MATLSNSTKPTSVLKSAFAAKQKHGSSPAGSPPLDPAKSAGHVDDDDEHIIRKCDSFIGGKL